MKQRYKGTRNRKEQVTRYNVLSLSGCVSSAKRHNLSMPPTRIAAELAAKLADVPTDQLAAELASVEGVVAQYRKSLQLAGQDPNIEALVARARAWTQGGPSASTLRALCRSVRVKKCKTSFDEEMADVRANATAADFEIQFALCEHEGFISGSMVDREGDIEGQVESSFIPILEDGLDQHVEWAEYTDEMQEEATKWCEAAGLGSNAGGGAAPISWQDTYRAVAATVFKLAEESECNDESWCLEYLEKRTKEELGRLPTDGVKRARAI